MSIASDALLKQLSAKVDDLLARVSVLEGKPSIHSHIPAPAVPEIENDVIRRKPGRPPGAVSWKNAI